MFNPSNLSQVPGFPLWFYSTEDSLSETLTPNYFTSLPLGAPIVILARDGGKLHFLPKSSTKLPPSLLLHFPEGSLRLTYNGELTILGPQTLTLTPIHMMALVNYLLGVLQDD